MGKREEEFLREGDFFLKKEIPLSRSPSLKNLLGGRLGIGGYSFCAFSVVEKAQRGGLLARACFASLLEGIRLLCSETGAAGAAFCALILEVRFSRGEMNAALFSFPFAGCAALAGLIGVLQVFLEIVL